MTSKPLSTASVHVTIPLKRSPAHEIQLDVLHLNQHFFNINYHIRFVVVAVDIFSRFVWMYPVVQLDVEKLQTHDYVHLVAQEFQNIILRQYAMK